MDRQTVEQTIHEYIKQVFGFALKRCKTSEDAEDLSQEIILRAFRALLVKDDIADMRKFIWTVAHNTLSNYYRDTAKRGNSVPIEDMAETLADPNAAVEVNEEAEVKRQLQGEIAYLSKLQRQIVIAYYFENRKQAEIAKDFELPVGTVKWHLFEAKKELKRGIDMMRKASELKFNPIKFDTIGINGSMGKKDLTEFFRSTLVQNICYCVRNTAKTVNEIADDLGVSPVYVETEVECLEEYDLLQDMQGKYRLNFLISEQTAEFLMMQDKMYKQAAELFANELYEELTTSGILDDPAIVCGQTEEKLSADDKGKSDCNFLLWTLIPYIAAWSGEELREERITFEEAATIRPDGGENIVHATVVPKALELPEDYVYMKNWCGPMWNGYADGMLWQIDSEWSDREHPMERNVPEESRKVVSFYHSDKQKELSKYDYAWLAEQGYIKTNGKADDAFRAVWQFVILNGKEINERLLAIGKRIKRKYKTEFEAIKEPYAKAVLASVPAHLCKIKEYELQFVFHADGLFLLHCIVCLLKNGKLKEPTEEQRKALTTLLLV